VIAHIAASAEAPAAILGRLSAPGSLRDRNPFRRSDGELATYEAAAWRRVTAMPTLLDAAETGAPACAVAALACTLP
jgi:hypothetical protein